MESGAEEALRAQSASGDGEAAGAGPAIRPAAPFSLLRYSPAVVLLAILLADSNRHMDPDLWGHLRFGQEFIAQRCLIRHDPYSFTAPGHLWRDHEWLAEVAMAVAYNAGGVLGLKLWKFACSGLTVLFIADAEAQTDAPPIIQTAVLLAAALALVLEMLFRPQMFTFVMLAALIALLARDNYRRDAPLWTVIPMMALWANLHGGFFVGIAALALYTGVATLCDLAAGAGWRRGIRLGALTVGAACATLLNPYGIGTWETVAHALRNPYTRDAITDWHPLIYAIGAQWRSARSGVLLYADAIAMVLALGAASAAGPRGGDLPLVAVAAMMAAAAFISVRNLALAAIVTSVPLARHLTLTVRHYRCAVAEPPASRPASQWLILVLCAALAIQGGLFSSRLAPDRTYPAGALAFMHGHGLHGNVLAEFGWGEYVIWHAVPPSRVFIDGRYDTVYPLSVIRDYLKFYFDLSGGSAAVKAYPDDFVLIGPHAPAARLMARQAGWKLLYRDNTALLYARADSAAAHLSGLPVNGVAPASAFP